MSTETTEIPFVLEMTLPGDCPTLGPAPDPYPTLTDAEVHAMMRAVLVPGAVYCYWLAQQAPS